MQRNNLKKVVQFLAVALVSLEVSGAKVLADTKIGFVDMQRALQAVDAGKKAKSQLEAEFNTKKTQLQAEETKIRKMTEDFKKQASVLSDAAKAEKQAKIQESIMKYQETTARFQQEIAMKEKEMTAPIIGGLRDIIAEEAKNGSYTLVLEKSENVVLYSKEGDLTEVVINHYNKRMNSGKKDG